MSRKSEEMGLDRSQHDEEYGGDGGTGLAEDHLPTAEEWFSHAE